MKLVDQLAEYHRRSQPAEVPLWLHRLWLPQGEARIAYLRELLEPEAKQPAERERG
ncbi:hypothetical protein R6Y99_06730 [Pseudomonas lundensis]|uniref:hypothetical protein n=1 Tax=Serratia proteamaculans TaxID=28151 RepID=UPI002981870A|nr:hypothetical protein [Serratia proteamaculans]MDW5499487.1 hypothetical protein [Serratia proteamaculans]MDW5504548.1 hypothetical protein [Pseudomonas lundensis]